MRISDWSSDVCSSDLASASIAGDRVWKRCGATVAWQRSWKWSQAFHLQRRRQPRGAPGRQQAYQQPGGGRQRQQREEQGRIEPRHVGIASRLQSDHPQAEQGQRQRQQAAQHAGRSEEHTSELQSLMRISYAVFCLKKKKTTNKSRN